MNAPRLGRGEVGTGGATSEESIANEGVPEKAEMDAGREAAG